MPTSKYVLRYLQLCQEEYDKGTPLVSDDIFDTLARKHKYHEVGARPITTKKIQHHHKMYSLRNVFDTDEPNPETLLKNPVKSPKLDGAAIELIYLDSILISASKRGDGTEGDDILDKAYLIPSIPNKLPTNVPNITGEISILGEIVAPKEILNSRNYAAGALGLKDLTEFKTRNLTFIVYGEHGLDEYSYIDSMSCLSLLGSFNTVLDKNWVQFPQDGVVYRENVNSIFKRGGYTSKHPRMAFAYKKKSDVEIVETTLEDVVWQLGKGGKVTPVALFTTININDAKVSRATLHNVGFIRNMELKYGDTILVTRSGGVIPKVVGKV